MSVVPIRPVFQDGQRLTAERLTQALEFLRTMLRRVLLAPLSSGVAGGFELTPTGGAVDSVLTIAPGLAIDGQGRLIVVPEGLTFSLTDITSGASISPAPGTVVRICLAQRVSAETDACSPLKALGVEEGFEVLFKQQEIDEALFEVVSSFTEPNSVAAWGDLDPPFATPEDSCVTLGHIIFADAFTFSATAFYRDGVSPRFNAIRNTAGTPSIFLNELNIPGGAFNPPGKFPGVAIPLTTLLGPNPVVVQPGAGLLVYALAQFAELHGVSVQATRVAPYGDAFSAGAMWPTDERVFMFPGGAGAYDPMTKTSEVPAGLSGLSAVPCEVDPSSDPIDRAGIPLGMGNAAAGSDLIWVRRTTTADLTLRGVSAGPEQFTGTHRVVPVAVAGAVRATVEHLGSVPLGSQLTASTVDGSLAIATTGEPVIARAAQVFLGTAGNTPMLVWVVDPSVSA